MSRFLKLFLAFMLFSILCIGLLVVGLVALVRQGEPISIPSNSVLQLSLAGTWDDRAPDPFWAGLWREDAIDSIQEVVIGLHAAKDDPKVKTLLVETTGFVAGWGVAKEIRDALLDFRSSGKKVIAYIQAAEDLDYYVATAADEIYLAPEGMMMVNGLSMETLFLKETFDKVGIQPDFHHRGEYKSATETFTRRSMSDANREATTAILDSLYDQMVAGIADGRRMSEEDVRGFIDDFVISGPRLVESGMIDGLRYLDQVLSDLAPSGREEPPLVGLHDYYKARVQEKMDKGTRVAVLYIAGEIRSGESGEGGLGGAESVGSATIAEAAKAIRDDEGIEAVVVRINSPGGSSLAADMMWHDIMRLRETRPVIISMSDLAASGGYWVATAGDTIVAQPGTLTGSIGVFMGKMNLARLFDKIGVSFDGVSRGRYARMFTSLRSFNPDELKRVDAMLDSTYNAFLSRVARGRNMTEAEVDKVARGRVWTGALALQHHLIDDLGGMEKALDIVRERLDLEPEAPLKLESFPRDDNILARWLKRLGLKVRVNLPFFAELPVGEAKEVRGGVHAALSLEDEGPQALLPFIPIIR